MIRLSEDTRTAARHVLDEAIAIEYEQGLATIPDGPGLTEEELEAAKRRPPLTPTILPAVVENGRVRPLDPAADLPDGVPAAIVIAR